MEDNRNLYPQMLNIFSDVEVPSLEVENPDQIPDLDMDSELSFPNESMSLAVACADSKAFDEFFVDKETILFADSLLIEPAESDLTYAPPGADSNSTTVSADEEVSSASSTIGPDPRDPVVPIPEPHPQPSPPNELEIIPNALVDVPIGGDQPNEMLQLQRPTPVEPIQLNLVQYGYNIGERPKWLPEGWGFHPVPRPRGTQVDMYYYSPAPHFKRFRSRVEVEQYLNNPVAYFHNEAIRAERRRMQRRMRQARLLRLRCSGSEE
ncbi:Methyl-CpG DNA binding [Dillenia turbinata]|uniref:Methyl-CpG DNA binding n=1 Tax=Dillenia turbinata TaxID=194707 RepID=A0AAN8Z6R5_9MAGN